MRNRVEIPSIVLIALAFRALLSGAAAFAAGPPADEGQSPVEMPMRVQTEGTTYGQYLQRQADLVKQLRSSVPAAAMHAPVRVELVKAVNPRLDVDGVQTNSTPGGPRRGPIALAVRTRDGGLAWAVEVSA